MLLWNDRFSEPGYAYGTQPNDFLTEVSHKIDGTNVLSVGEGEGRNAVYLAGQGFAVTAIDSASVGLRKAEALAYESGVSIQTIVSDLADYDPRFGVWDGIVSIFCHLPSTIRINLHKKLVDSLKPGGVLILEAYTPAQLDYKTGGPKQLDFFMTLEGLQSELSGLTFEIAREVEREIHEGRYHNGQSAVVQLLARKL